MSEIKLKVAKSEKLLKQFDFVGVAFELVTAANASSIVTFGAARSKPAEQCIVLDTVAEFDGLECLFMIGVGLDRPMKGFIGVSTRSLYYRMVSRSQMVVMAVNRFVRGGG